MSDRLELDVLFVLRNERGEIFSNSEMSWNTFTGYKNLGAARRAISQLNRRRPGNTWKIVAIHVDSLDFSEPIE
jgi:hypothetical protein